MNDSAHASALMNSLDPEALLQLASQAADSDEHSPAYAVPAADELSALFPELEMIELVGSGGMGCVYRARQTRLDRDVALKLLPRELGSDDRFAERFAREARAMARLNHPSIVAIHDFGERSGLHFLIMEFMDGMNLRELLDSGRLEISEALGIFEQICEALAYAHAEGVVHRDIKPENILFSKTGHVALADFGLARLATDSSAAVVSITQTRQAMGTLNYMAPEQWENPKSVDHRADVYSLGILLYELLTGRIPRGSFPPPSSVCGVPQRIDEAVNKALQVDAKDRHHDVAEFCQAVVGSTTERPITFDHNGTLTNFVNAGANVLRMVPRPRKLPHVDRPGKHAVWSSLIVGICVAILTSMPWVYAFNRSYLGIETYTQVEGVRIPVLLLPVASSLIFGLAVFRRLIHPLRADLVSLAICGLSIALTALSLDQLYVFSWHRLVRAESFSVNPFLVLLVLCFQAIETLNRLVLTLWTPVAETVERRLKRKQEKEEENKARWYARWKAVVNGWHEFRGTDRRRRDEQDSGTVNPSEQDKY